MVEAGSASQAKEAVSCTEPCFQIRDSQDRGKGVYATRDIPAGTRIIAEAPLMVIPHRRYMMGDVEAAFSRLTPNAQATYMALASAHGQSPRLWPSRVHESVGREEKQRIMEQHSARLGSCKTVLSVMMTNAMPWGADLQGSAVFETACRCNHSCVPNAYFAWNHIIGKETVHVTKPISAGSEITVAYCDPLYDEAVRSHELQHYGFQCDCEACYSPSGCDEDTTCFAAASKERRFRLREIDQLLGRGLYCHGGGCATPNMERRVALLLEEISLLREEGLISPRLGNSYFELADICFSQGDYAFAVKGAKQGYRTIAICVGEDAPTARAKRAVLDGMLQRMNKANGVDELVV